MPRYFLYVTSFNSNKNTELIKSHVTDRKTQASLGKTRYLPKFSNQLLSNTESESSSILFKPCILFTRPNLSHSSYNEKAVTNQRQAGNEAIKITGAVEES